MSQCYVIHKYNKIMHFAYLVLLTQPQEYDSIIVKTPAECPLFNYGWNTNMDIRLIKPVAMRMVLASSIYVILGILATCLLCKNASYKFCS